MQAPFQTLVTMRSMMIVGLMCVAAGCSDALQIVEPGAAITEYRVVTPYNKIDVRRALNLTVVIGQRTDSVRLVVSEGFLPFVRVTVEDSTLVLDIDNSVDISNLRSNVVTVVVPDVKRITASGGSRVTLNDTMNIDDLTLQFSGASAGSIAMNAATLNVEASGSSLLILRGFADVFNAKPISGGSIIQAYDVFSRLCTVDASGASILEVNVSEHLNVRASGASLVSYKGNPVVVSELTGGSKVQKAP
jgi:hypothetical protein